MRTILLIFLCLSFFIHAFSQYTVTKVVGTVKKKSTGEFLKPGVSLSQNDKLLWSSPNDLVRTIVAGKGIFIIAPSPKAQKEGTELVEIVQFTLHIKPKEFNLSGRGEKYELLPEAFQTVRNVNPKLLIEAENKYVFNRSDYDIADGGRFFLQIDIQGNKPIIKSLKTIKDTLIIHDYDFLTGGGSSIINNIYKVGYFSANKHSSINVAEITPYFDSTSEMENLIRIITLTGREPDKDILQQICYSEVYHSLGKPSEIVFEKIFSKVTSSLKQ